MSSPESPNVSRVSLGGLFLLAFDGLLRKKSRNTLTALGVVIGVFAMITIISLSNGMEHIISGTVSGEENLRQISVTPGIGYRFDPQNINIPIEGEFDATQQDRLRRAALARRRHPGNQVAARVGFDARTIEEIRALPNVAMVQPLIAERYLISLKDEPLGRESAAQTPRLTYGVDVNRKRYENYGIAGRYFSGNNAREVVLHEYLAYQWGFRSTEAMAALVGRTLRIEPVNGAIDTANIQSVLGLLGDVAGKIQPGDFDTLMQRLEPDEAQALQMVLAGLAMSRQGANAPSIMPLEPGELAFPIELEIVGVARDKQRGDNFNVIEDGNAYQVDVFLPHATADEIYRASASNRQRGYMNLLTMVNDREHAQPTEQAIRGLGHTAYSVGTAMERVSSVLDALTLAISFLTGIALLVASLGIVNTMLTSVLERTREIGLWKALGATAVQIRQVFLFEAALIGLIGGLIGLGLAVVVMIPLDGFAIAELSKQLVVPFEGSVFDLPLWLAIAGPVLATVIAMLASLVPAWRASRVDPVVALREG